ncbi:shK domain-like domain-containing protein [Ditylenchus destructor]|uniref:ShK domain-like domain-containing protein n=1 Tax=Ditylenchus destructor TaxID=166010 RepID=A0AAD4R5G1_9BILA|nr:shK domain-like domain-containing protein [Ditylenchus destructor]
MGVCFMQRCYQILSEVRQVYCAGNEDDPDEDGPDVKEPDDVEPGNPDGPGRPRGDVDDSDNLPGDNEDESDPDGSDPDGSGPDGSGPDGSDPDGSDGSDDNDDRPLGTKAGKHKDSKRRKGRSESDGSDSDDSGALPPPDATPTQALPGNWGVNCPSLAQSGMCNNPLYKTVMQRSCKTSCGQDDCVDSRPDLCGPWSQRNFCQRDFYASVKHLCALTCHLCQPSNDLISSEDVSRR